MRLLVQQIERMVTPILELIQRFDWSGFAILTSTKSHYVRTANLLAEAAGNHDLAVAYHDQFQAVEDAKNASTIHTHIGPIMDSGARVVFLFGDCPDGKLLRVRPKSCGP